MTIQSNDHLRRNSAQTTLMRADRFGENPVSNLAASQVERLGRNWSRATLSVLAGAVELSFQAALPAITKIARAVRLHGEVKLYSGYRLVHRQTADPARCDMIVYNKDNRGAWLVQISKEDRRDAEGEILALRTFDGSPPAGRPGSNHISELLNNPCDAKLISDNKILSFRQVQIDRPVQPPILIEPEKNDLFAAPYCMMALCEIVREIGFGDHVAQRSAKLSAADNLFATSEGDLAPFIQAGLGMTAASEGLFENPEMETVLAAHQDMMKAALAARIGDIWRFQFTLYENGHRSHKSSYREDQLGGLAFSDRTHSGINTYMSANKDGYLITTNSKIFALDGEGYPRSEEIYSFEAENGAPVRSTRPVRLSRNVAEREKRFWPVFGKLSASVSLSPAADVVDEEDFSPA